MVPIIRVARKRIKIREAPARTDPENSADPVSSAVEGRAVEIAIAALNQCGLWIGSILGRAIKQIQICIAAAGSDSKYGAAAIWTIGSSAAAGRAVKIPVAGP